MDEITTIQKFAIWVLPVLFGITVHEAAHGWVASLLGDNTARKLGRLTVNPIKHIDPVGTILVPGLTFALGGIMFGWAKPVPVDFQKLRSPKRDMALVALAGPLSNLGMAIVWALLAKVAVMIAFDPISVPLMYMCGPGVLFNMVLMVLNLLPIPPLDGGRIMTGILPGKYAMYFSRIEPYGLLILVLLITTGLLGDIIGSPIHFAYKELMNLVSL